MELPTTQALRPRPVWKRHLVRSLRNLEDPGPPTEEECVDAVQVLKLSQGEIWDTLALEAFRIFDEAGK